MNVPGLRASATTLQRSRIDALEDSYPGYLQEAIDTFSADIDARMCKRYGKSAANALPWRTAPPELFAQGTNPPALTLASTLTGQGAGWALGCMCMQVRITTLGALGVAQLQWSSDKGVTWNGPIPSAAIVNLGGPGVSGLTKQTGLELLMPATGVWAVDNFYFADPPVPRAILRWLVDLVTARAYDKVGTDPKDPKIERAMADAERAEKQMAEAASAKDSLFGLPEAGNLDATQTIGGPAGYSESSPYAWADQQVQRATQEDSMGRGTNN